MNSTPEQIAAIRERLGLDAALICSTSPGSAGSSAATSVRRCSRGTGRLGARRKAQVTIPLGLMAMTVALLIALRSVSSRPSAAGTPTARR
jgi:peptide/nickel transport system permease protein